LLQSDTKQYHWLMCVSTAGDNDSDATTA